VETLQAESAGVAGLIVGFVIGFIGGVFAGWLASKQPPGPGA